MANKKTIKYELILLFNNFDYSPKIVYQKLQKHYSRTTIYRYYRHWQEAKNALKAIQKEL